MLRVSALFAGAVLAVLPLVASAADGYDAETRHPPHDGSGSPSLWGSQTLDPGAVYGDAAVDYARDPVVLRLGNEIVSPVVHGLSTTEIGASVGLPGRLQIDGSFSAAQRTFVTPVGTDGESSARASGVGDARLHLKWTALSPIGLVPGVAVIAGSALPSGDGRSWLGSGAASPEALLALEEHAGPVVAIVNGGYRTRPRENVLGTQVGSEAILGGGLVWDTGASGVTVIAEAIGAVTPGGSTAEAGLGLRRDFGRLALSAGADAGIGSALGTPVWRSFGAIGWRFGARSRDVPRQRLGSASAATPAPPPPSHVAWSLDAAAPVKTPAPVPTPAPAKDPTSTARIAARAGIELYQQGIFADSLTKLRDAEALESALLPVERALVHKYVASCEAMLDQGAQAQSEFYAAISLQPGMTLDRASTPQKVLAAFDAANALKKSETPLALAVKVVKDHIEIPQAVHFMTNTAEIHIDSYPLLGAVADFLLKHPEIESVVVEGYTDVQGDPRANIALSKARAKAVRDYLVHKGISPLRLDSHGYGPARPIATNSTPEGRAVNRRVEFRIAKRR